MSFLFSAASQAALHAKPLSFYASPEPAGRRIVCGFSSIQRIGKAASTDIWFPSSLHKAVAERIAAGDESVLDEFRAEWAAVRQFELLQESDNYYIFDLKVEHFTRAYDDIVKMRARGYRITVITLGTYAAPTDDDELRILDVKLQDEIAQLIHMLYLEEQSKTDTAYHAKSLREDTWSLARNLPHVAMTLGAGLLFAPKTRDAEDGDETNASNRKKRKGEGDARQLRMSAAFFDLLNKLPSRHIVHDVAVGLALPESINRQNWVYCAPGEYQYTTFQTALATVFRAADHLSLSALHEREGATNEIMPAMHHMRGYGDRNDPHNAASAAYLLHSAFVEQGL